MCSAIVMAAPVRRAQMAGDALSLVENLDRLVGDARINQFLDEAEGRRIPVAVDLDVVVGGDATALPDRESVRLARQRLQRRFVDGHEQFGPARVIALHDAGVDVAEQFADRDVQIGGAEEPPIAQSRQNPALGDQNRLLDLGLALSRQLQLVLGRPGLQFASRIPSTRLSGSPSSLSAAARTGAKTV